LELLEEEQTVSKYAEIIRNIKDDLVLGHSLWEALQKSGPFTPYEYYAIQIGEETGKLIIVMEQLYQYFATRLKQRRQFVNALSYPVIILITSIGAVTFMLLFIVPMFDDVFKRFGGELPVMTQIIIDLAAFFRERAYLIGLAILFVVYFFHRNRNKTWMLAYSTKVMKRIPVLGTIVYSLHLARFCSSMSLLLGSKVPLLRSLNLVHQMIDFYPIQISLKTIENEILHGAFLHASMAGFPVYDKKFISLVKIGEEVNKLDVFFEKLSKQYSSDAEHRMGLLGTFLEPFMIIFLGLVVGFILLAMYLPMFQLSTSVGG